MSRKFEINSTSQSTKYEISIWDNIESYEDYNELLKKIKNIKKADTVLFKVATPGGRCDVGFMLIDVFKALPCKVDVVVPYPTYSMGAIMSLCGDSLTINDGSFLMFHDYSTGGRSKGNEIFKSTEAYNEIFAHRFNSICQPFLSKKECEDVLQGKDLYIKWNDPTLDARCKRHFKEG